MLVGAIYVVYGAALLVDPVSGRDRILGEWLPEWGLAVPWFVAGLVACATSMMRRHEWWGYASLFAWASITVVTSLVSWLVYDSQRALTRAVSWVVVSLIILLVAGWKEPDGADDGGG